MSILFWFSLSVSGFNKYMILNASPLLISCSKYIRVYLYSLHNLQQFAKKGALFFQSTSMTPIRSQINLKISFRTPCTTSCNIAVSISFTTLPINPLKASRLYLPVVILWQIPCEGRPAWQVINFYNTIRRHHSASLFSCPGPPACF